MEENEDSHRESSLNDYHLEYLNQFLQLKSAPDLIRMGLFPNAKEITESFAMWTALRQFIFPQLLKCDQSIDNGENAIIVVGDGMTPRTAALCAFLTKGLWKCFSIDPILQYDTFIDTNFIHKRTMTTIEHCQLWKTIKSLKMIRDQIQRITIECRKAIIVMMHAHVSIEDAVNAVNASQGIVAIVTCPCCQWKSYQEQFYGQAPHQKYTDLRLLSVKNEINVWCFPQGYFHKSSSINSTTENEQISIDENRWGMDINTIQNILSNRNKVKERAIQLWPQLFSVGIKAFGTTNIDQSNLNQHLIEINEDHLHDWKWSSTTWSPKDILPLIKSLPSPTDQSTFPSWFKKPVLIVGTIGAMRKCKHTIFYQLTNCDIPSEELQQIFQMNSSESSTLNIHQDEFDTSDETFPQLLKYADRIWSCVEYQRHRLSTIAFDSTKRQNNHPTQSSSIHRVNILLSLLSHQNIHSTHLQSNHLAQNNLFHHNPKPRETLFPWAMSLRPGDILVAFCQLGYNGLQRPILCFVDGILLFDSKLLMFGVDRRIIT